jgi:oxaloacetate decarboxylase beta subunit
MKKLLTVIGVLVILGTVSPAISALNEQSTVQGHSATAVDSDVSTAKTPADDAPRSVAVNGIKKFISYTGFANATPGHLLMLAVGLFFIFLAIRYHYEPLLLIPIGVGILIGNIPFMLNAGLKLGIYEEGSVMNYLY